MNSEDTFNKLWLEFKNDINDHCIKANEIFNFILDNNSQLSDIDSIEKYLIDLTPTPIQFKDKILQLVNISTGNNTVQKWLLDNLNSDIENTRKNFVFLTNIPFRILSICIQSANNSIILKSLNVLLYKDIILNELSDGQFFEIRSLIFMSDYFDDDVISEYIDNGYPIFQKEYPLVIDYCKRFFKMHGELPQWYINTLRKKDKPTVFTSDDHFSVCLQFIHATVIHCNLEEIDIFVKLFGERIERPLYEEMKKSISQLSKIPEMFSKMLATFTPNSMTIHNLLESGEIINLMKEFKLRYHKSFFKNNSKLMSRKTFDILYGELYSKYECTCIKSLIKHCTRSEVLRKTWCDKFLKIDALAILSTKFTGIINSISLILPDWVRLGATPNELNELYQNLKQPFIKIGLHQLKERFDVLLDIYKVIGGKEFFEYLILCSKELPIKLAKEFKKEFLPYHKGYSKKIKTVLTKKGLTMDIMQMIIAMDNASEFSELLEGLVTRRIVECEIPEMNIDYLLETMKLHILIFPENTDKSKYISAQLTVLFLQLNKIRDDIDLKEEMERVSKSLAEVILVADNLAPSIFRGILLYQSDDIENLLDMRENPVLDEEPTAPLGEILELPEYLDRNEYSDIQYTILIKTSFLIGYGIDVFDSLISDNFYKISDILTGMIEKGTLCDGNEEYIKLFIDRYIVYLPKITFKTLLFKYPKLVLASKTFQEHREKLIDLDIKLEIKYIQKESLYCLLSETSQQLKDLSKNLLTITDEHVLGKIVEYLFQLEDIPYNQIAMLSKRFFRVTSRALSKPNIPVAFHDFSNSMNSQFNVFRYGITTVDYSELPKVPKQLYEKIHSINVDNITSFNISLPSLKYLRCEDYLYMDLTMKLLEHVHDTIELIHFSFDSSDLLTSIALGTLQRFLLSMKKGQCALKSVSIYFFQYNPDIESIVPEIRKHFQDDANPNGYWIENLVFGFYGFSSLGEIDDETYPLTILSKILGLVDKLSMDDNGFYDYNSVFKNCQTPMVRSLALINCDTDYSGYSGLSMLKALRKLEFSISSDSIIDTLAKFITTLQTLPLLYSLRINLRVFTHQFNNDIRFGHQFISFILSEIFRQCTALAHLKKLSIYNSENPSIPLISHFGCNVNTRKFTNVNGCIFKVIN
ncbi:RapGAP/RanGAP domain-containing protein [Tieghemostelium lacteum]|uniref:RapGAP/RanGAP domain-containing protein n=1 Tax=Tieghemostelium lacteum TaxID=361077 RepID=A0A151ZSG3_TIELA|nr:RapGAP/RanGAP domain-containing protein [Tieghemostelium lacteum]|eukprot:KYQ96835.1 RapGAP/RanGAP domain-containing protein [Tieghemostelium lacteum]